MVDDPMVVYEERQAFPSWAMAVLLLACLGGIVAATAAILAERARGGNWQLAAAILGAVVLTDGILLVLLVGGMRTAVTSAGLRIRLGHLPFVARIPLEGMVSCQAVRYEPVRQFGGWGIRFNARLRTKAWTGRGNRGVLLTRSDGSRVLIGSDEPEGLCAAVRSVGVAGVSGEGVLE